MWKDIVLFILSGINENGNKIEEKVLTMVKENDIVWLTKTEI